MNETPAIAEAVRIVAFHVKSLVGVVLKDRSGVVASFNQQIDGLRSELGCKETIEENRPPAALRMADFSGEKGTMNGAKLAARTLLMTLIARAHPPQ